MKQLCVCIFLTMLVSMSSAQESSPITILDGKYYHNDVAVSNKAIKSIVADVPDAYKEIKKGSARNITGIVFSGLGGAMLGTSLADIIVGTSYYSDDPKTGVIAGIAFIAGGVWLSISGARKIANGVEIYNHSFDTAYRLPGASLRLGATSQGVGFTYTF